MNYQYKTVELSMGYSLDATIQSHANEGWRLHSIFKNNSTTGGTITRSDLNNSNISFYTNDRFVLIFEKKPVMEEIKDIMHDRI